MNRASVPAFHPSHFMLHPLISLSDDFRGIITLVGAVATNAAGHVRGCLRGCRRRPIIAAVPRRLHVSRLNQGEIVLDSVQAHHARDVLRLTEGTVVEVFDDAGRSSQAATKAKGQFLAAYNQLRASRGRTPVGDDF